MIADMRLAARMGAGGADICSVETSPRHARARRGKRARGQLHIGAAWILPPLELGCDPLYRWPSLHRAARVDSHEACCWTSSASGLQ